MNFFNVLTLLGGLAMFLYGMRLMGDGLKQSSSGTLKVAMERVTNNPIKAFLLGVGITAIIQSSTATIVITAGLVGAGLLSLHQSLGIIIGANVGTTVTGQIIRLLDMDASAGSWLQLFKPSSLAPIALIIGIVLIMGAKFRNARQIGNIAIGFGILFSGLLNMTSAVNTLSESGFVDTLFDGLGTNPLLGYGIGAGVAFMLQSSSATIGILQAFSASGALTFNEIYPVIVGIYLGDCVTTAIVCSIGANSESKRIGVVNILFNLSETVVVLAVVTVLHQAGLIDGIWNMTVNSGSIANTNTIFNLSCAIVLFPMLPIYERMSRRIVKDEAADNTPNKYQDKFDALNPNFLKTPALALRSCYDLLLTQFRAARANVETAFTLLAHFDADKVKEIYAEEDNIDLMADRVSKYITQLLPGLREEYHTAILDQYYKVVSEFERLGDIAIRIADNAEELDAAGKSFSENAQAELRVLEDLLDQIMDCADLAFSKRDVNAAFRIEPLEEVTGNLVNSLKVNHLKRMSSGVCDIYADANYMNLLSDMKRIADVCSNVGEATVIRVMPELADQEHDYFAALHSGRNEDFNKVYEATYKDYFGRLAEVTGKNKEAVPATV